jgi:hypothetical protein
MPSYIAKTHEDWVSFLRDEGITDSINFWSPNPTPLLRALPSNRLFFYSKCPPDGKRRLVGYGKVREYLALSVAEAWSRFGVGNGATSIEEKLDRLNSFSSVNRDIDRNMVIGNTILDEVEWLEEPVDIESKGVTVAPQVVRGRSLTIDEEVALIGPNTDSPTALGVRQLLADLNAQYQGASPTRKQSVSNRIERNSLLVKLLKQIHPERCQLCREPFFWKKGQISRYSEVHHIKELSSGGRDAADNCLVLCANCHRKLHYGNITLEDAGADVRVKEGVGATVTVGKNIINPDSYPQTENE